MSPLVSLNLVKGLRIRDKIQGLPRNLLLFASGMVVIR